MLLRKGTHIYYGLFYINSLRISNDLVFVLVPATRTYELRVQWDLGSRTPLITNKSVHEQIFRKKNVSGDERCLE
jgi:hypothetical protein